MQLTIAFTSHPGGRINNQDYCTYSKTTSGTLMVLADGMGGHQGGELASRFFCEACVAQLGQLEQQLADDPESGLQGLIANATHDMQQRLIAEAEGVDAHTTCVLCWITKQKVVSAHVGDSRLYRFLDKKLVWRTKDHSITQLLVMQGEITEEETAHHPDQSTLYRSIGPKDAPKPSIKSLPPLEPGEALLLCSDGLWTEATETEMMAMLDSNPIQPSMEKLVNKVANRVGDSSDNITVMLAKR